MTGITNINKAAQGLDPVVLAQLAALRQEPRVKDAVAYLDRFTTLADNVHKLQDLLDQMDKAGDLEIYEESCKARRQVLDLCRKVCYVSHNSPELSFAVCKAYELRSIIKDEAPLALSDYPLVTAKMYTPILSWLGLITFAPASAEKAFTESSSLLTNSKATLLTDGSDLVAQLTDTVKQYKASKNADRAINELRALANQVYKVLGVLQYIDVRLSILMNINDALIAGTVNKIVTGNPNVSMFISPALDSVLKEFHGLLLDPPVDPLFLERGVYSSNVSERDLEYYYSSALQIAMDLFEEVDLKGALVHISDKYFTLQYNPNLIKDVVSKYWKLFLKSLKASYDPNGFLPKKFRRHSYKSTYVTHAAHLGKSDVGILGTDVVATDVSVLHVIPTCFPELINVQGLAKSRGHLTTADSYILDPITGEYVESKVCNYLCSEEQLNKYKSSELLSAAFKVVFSLNTSTSSECLRYFDSVGRVYNKVCHDFYSPQSNKVFRDLVRPVHDVQHSDEGVDFNSEFDSDGKLVWVSWDPNMSAEEYLDKCFGSNSYQIFAEFATKLGLKVRGTSTITDVMEKVQTFFDKALGGLSLADKATYTKDVASKLWVFLEDSHTRYEKEPEVYSGAIKFLKAMFSELPQNRCSFTVAYDATSSVTQIISIFLGDESLMEGSNVISNGSSNVEDIYIRITEEFLTAYPELLGEEYLQLPDQEKADYLPKFLTENRPIVKKGYMTFIYGSPVRFLEAYGEEGVKKFYEFLDKNYPNFSRFVKTFDNLWYNNSNYTFNFRTRSAGRKEEYKAVMPDGFNFIYVPTKSVDIYCPPYELKLKISTSQVGYDLLNKHITYSDKKVRKSSDRSFSPNMVHAIDALICRETILMCERLPQIYHLIFEGVYMCVNKVFGSCALDWFEQIFRNAPSGLIKGISSNLISKEEARKLYYSVVGNNKVYAMLKYIVAHKDDLMTAMHYSRFVSALWLLPFAGVALLKLGSIFGRSNEVNPLYASLANIAEEFLNNMIVGIQNTYNQAAGSTETFMYMYNQFVGTLDNLPKEPFSVTTIHDSFHVRPVHSEELFKVVRLQYAKYAESDLFEYLLGSFFGNDFVTNEGLNFVTHKDKVDISAKVFNSKFLVTF